MGALHRGARFLTLSFPSNMIAKHDIGTTHTNVKLHAYWFIVVLAKLDGAVVWDNDLTLVFGLALSFAFAILVVVLLDLLVLDVRGVSEMRLRCWQRHHKILNFWMNTPFFNCSNKLILRNRLTDLKPGGRSCCMRENKRFAHFSWATKVATPASDMLKHDVAWLTSNASHLTSYTLPTLVSWLL